MDLKRYPLARSPVAAAATACQQLFRSYRARCIYRGRLILALLAEDDSASAGSPAAPAAFPPTPSAASSTLPPPESPVAQAVRELESRVLAIADRVYAGRARRHREYVCAILLQRSTRRWLASRRHASVAQAAPAAAERKAERGAGGGTMHKGTNASISAGGINSAGTATCTGAVAAGGSAAVKASAADSIAGPLVPEKRSRIPRLPDLRGLTARDYVAMTPAKLRVVFAALDSEEKMVSKRLIVALEARDALTVTRDALQNTVQQLMVRMNAGSLGGGVAGSLR